MKIHYVTTNIGKVKALQQSCLPYNIIVEQVAIELPESRSNDVHTGDCYKKGVYCLPTSPQTCGCVGCRFLYSCT